jgi:hypothetical protein
MINHTGTEKASNKEYWTISESLIQQYYVRDESLFWLKTSSIRKKRNKKSAISLEFFDLDCL